MKNIPISGVQWEVKTSPEYGGGFDSGEAVITVGTGVKNMIPTIFLHEVLEAIMTERGCRYKINPNGGNGDMLFSFNHKEYDNIARDLALAIGKFLNLDGLIAQGIQEEKIKAIENEIEVRRRTKKKEKVL